MLQQKNILLELPRRQAKGESFALATVVRAVSPTAAQTGAKALIFGDGQIDGWIGGGCAQPAVIKTARQCLRDGESRLIRVSPESDKAMMEGMEDFKSHCHSGGSLDIFIEPIISAPSLRVYGESPAAQALVALAARSGFSVTVLAHGLDQAAFPDAERCINGFDLEGSAEFAVIATQGKGDLQAMRKALNSGTPFISMVASSRKGTALKATLIDEGGDEERVNQVICPGGLEIGAQTPEEVALSVAAQLVAQRRLSTEEPIPTTEPEAESSCCSKSESTPVPEPVEAKSCCGDIDEH